MKAIMAFNTNNEMNRLTGKQLAKRVKAITQVAGGVTATEHLGGYKREDNGQLDIEYSYEFEVFNDDKEVVAKLTDLFHDWGVLNQQESIIIDGNFIDTTGDLAW